MHQANFIGDRRLSRGRNLGLFWIAGKSGGVAVMVCCAGTTAI